MGDDVKKALRQQEAFRAVLKEQCATVDSQEATIAALLEARPAVQCRASSGSPQDANVKLLEDQLAEVSCLHADLRGAISRNAECQKRCERSASLAQERSAVVQKQCEFASEQYAAALMTL